MALTDNLVAYWSLEADGTDATGRGNDLTNVGASFVAGKVGNCADLEASESDYLWRADNADLSMGDIDFTIAAWVKIESGVGAIVLKDDETTREYRLDQTIGNLLRWRVFNGAAVGTVTASTYGSPPAGVWHFITCWHDSMANTVSIQVNGGAVDSAATTGSPADTAVSFKLGAAGIGVSPFDGLIDEVGIWKRVLTAAEITTLYNGGAGLAYPFTTSVPLMQRFQSQLLAG